MAVDNTNYGLLCATMGWKCYYVCTTCNKRADYANTEFKGWKLQLFPSPKIFILTNNKGLRVADGGFNLLKETLEKYAKENTGKV